MGVEPIKSSFLKLMILQYIRKHDKLTGYEFMKFCREKGLRVSPGTIYPHLKDLSDRKILTVVNEGRKKYYILTEKGKKTLEELESRKEEIKKLVSKLGIMWETDINIPRTVLQALRKFLTDLHNFDWNRGNVRVLLKDIEKLAETLRRWKNESDRSS